ncbi:MAG: SPASM domain-containing protein, partial [Candidatus Omnitrophota bacterium]
DLLDELNNYPIRITVLTNGTLIDKETIRRLQRMKFLEAVQVSIDGSCSEIHDWQRGKGSFLKAIEAVKLLRKNSITVKTKAIINTHNYTDIEGMIKLAIDMGRGGMDFGDAVECGRAAVYSRDMTFEGEIHRRIMDDLFALRKKYPDFVIGGSLGQKMEMLEDFYKNGPGKGNRGVYSTCPAGQNMLSIRSDGKVVPCSAFWTLICGDIRKDSLRDIWDNSEVLNEIRGLAEEPLVKNNPICEGCDYLSYCNGGCRASAYYSSGNDLKGIDRTNCFVFSGVHGFRMGKETVLSSKGMDN